MESTTKNQSLTQIFTLLKYTFGIVPIVAGADKFTNLLTDWTQYINPSMVDLLPFSAATFMMIVVVILYGNFYKATDSNAFSCLVSIGVGAIIYLTSIFVLRVFSIDELKNRFRKV